MRAVKNLVPLVFASTLLVSSAAPAAPGESGFPGANGKIMYLDLSTGLLVTINPDSSGRATIPYDPSVVIETWEPIWSSDGERIAQVSVGNLFDIWAMNANGSSPRNVTNQAGDESDPTWSPNGTQIAYAHHPRGVRIVDDTWVVNADGTGRVNLTYSSGVSEAAPAWSPDGTRIAFATDRDGNFEIYTMNPDGTGLTRLTNNPANDGVSDTREGRRISWSPDSTKVAFASDRDGNWEIYSMNADGTALTRLTNNPADDTDPRWSPDGSKIAFVNDQAGNDDVYSMNADGSGIARLTNNPADQIDPDWQPIPSADVFVNVSDTGFTPQSPHLAQGDIVRWNFAGSTDHNVTDPSGLGLFGSGGEPSGGAYATQFSAAGTYATIDTTTSNVGTIRVPARVAPKVGKAGAVFTVTVSTSPPPEGFVFDIQIKRPGQPWFAWRTNWLSRSAQFNTYASTHRGIYSFRARLRRITQSTGLEWSPAASCWVR